MKKLLLSGIIALSLFPFATHAAFDANLKYGSTGPAVVELQEFLISQGTLSGTATGNFYSLTLKAVKDFQSSQGIMPISGYWGPLSRAKASLMTDIAASDDDEQTETGNVSAPIVQTPVSQNQILVPAPASNVLPASMKDFFVITDEKVESVPDAYSGTHTKEKITWTTSIPTSGKVFYNANSSTYGDADMHVIPSISGISTQHMVYISDYSSNPGITYNYKIESISADGTNSNSVIGSHTIPIPN